MRIAFITYEFPPHIEGGAGVYARKLTALLAGKGHQVVVFTPEAPNREPLLGRPHTIEVRTIEGGALGPLRTFNFWIRTPGAVAELHRQCAFDLVHVNSLSYWYLMGRPLHDVPQVATIHHLVRDAAEINSLPLMRRVQDFGGENGFVLPIVEKQLVKSVDHIIAVSDFTKERIIKTYGMPATKITTVRNGIERREVNLVEPRVAKLRESLGLPNKPIVLFVGRVDDPRKGLTFLLNAFSRLRERVDAMLLVVGSGSLLNARILVDGLRLSSNVVFTGHANDSTLTRFYDVCDVFACPSKLEGFGLTVGEAIAAGKPVVSVRTGAIPEIIQYARKWSLTEPGDEEGFSNALYHHIFSDQNVGDPMTETPWQVSDALGWSETANGAEAVYLHVLGRA